MKILYKKPAETYSYLMSFTGDLRSNEIITQIISSSSVVEDAGSVVDPSNIVINSVSIDSSKTGIIIQIASGDLNVLYKISVLIKTSNVNEIQGDGLLKIITNI